MKRCLALTALLACAAVLWMTSSGKAKAPTGSYIQQYLTLSAQITPALRKLRKDVYMATGVVQAPHAKLKLKKKKKSEPAKESAAATTAPKKPAAPAVAPDAAALRSELLDDLPDRVEPIRNKAMRLRKIGPVPRGLESTNLLVRQYSRRIDSLLDVLKTAAYSGKADQNAIDLQFTAAENQGTRIEHLMGEYLDSTPITPR